MENGRLSAHKVVQGFQMANTSHPQLHRQGSSPVSPLTGPLGKGGSVQREEWWPQTTDQGSLQAPAR